MTATTSEEFLTNDANRASLWRSSRSSVSAALSSASATCEESALRLSATDAGISSGVADDHHPAELVAHEQRRDEHGALLVRGQRQRLADRALVGLHDVGVAIQQPLPFPVLQDVQREVRADRVAGVAVGRDHDELVGPSVEALAQPDRRALAGQGP